MASMTKYRATLVALHDDGSDDLDTYAEEFEFEATGDELTHVVMPLACLDAGMPAQVATEALFTTDAKRRLASLAG